MESKTVIETHINKTLYVVTSECSASATETIEKKLERLMCGRLSDTKSYHSMIEMPLDVCEAKSEHGTDS